MRPHEIKGHGVAKRAFEVAAVGGLGVLLVGPLGAGKTTIRDAFPEVRSAEREPCLCGHYQDVMQPCICKPVAVARWYRRMERLARGFDIILETVPLTTREMMATHRPDPQEQVWREQRISQARQFGETHQSLAMDETAHRTMEMCARRMSLTVGQYDTVLRVARAVANLDASGILKAKHVAEAAQYGVSYIRMSQRRAEEAAA